MNVPFVLLGFTDMELTPRFHEKPEGNSLVPSLAFAWLLRVGDSPRLCCSMAIRKILTLEYTTIWSLCSIPEARGFGDPAPPLDTPEVVGGLKTWLFEGQETSGASGMDKIGLASTPF